MAQLTAVGRRPSVADDGDDRQAFEGLGYMAPCPFFSFTSAAERKESSHEILVQIDCHPQVRNALEALPCRKNLDALLRHFLTHLNFHYYIIQPPEFLRQYRLWWEKRISCQTVDLQWTCLLLMICACSVQHLGSQSGELLGSENHEPDQHASERLYSAARQLHSLIPLQSYHIHNVTMRLYLCSWYMNDGRLVECWHELSTAVREAQELGMHRESNEGSLPLTERELRRRVWAVLDIWDWQISSRLHRPAIIDRTDSDTRPPSLISESYNPSPLIHMHMQLDLTRKLAVRFGTPTKVITLDQVEEHTSILQNWMKEFPDVIRLDQPASPSGNTPAWIVFQRQQLQVTAYQMILSPIKAYIAKAENKTAMACDVKTWCDCLYYSFKLMKLIRLNLVDVNNGRGYYQPITDFFLDNIKAVCTAIRSAGEQVVLNQEDLLEALHETVSMLGMDPTVSKMTGTFHTDLDLLVEAIQRDYH